MAGVPDRSGDTKRIANFPQRYVWPEGAQPHDDSDFRHISVDDYEASIADQKAYQESRKE